MKIPVYIINLKSRSDRRDHIIREFQGRDEFTWHLVDACQHVVGAVGLWATIRQVIWKARTDDLEYVLVCEDDHQFTAGYSAPLLYSCIEWAKENRAAILSGGVSWYQDILQVSGGIFWADKFTGGQFLIIFKNLYDTILNATFDEQDASDLKLSFLTDAFFFIYPFISVQKDFGYSDVTEANNKAGETEELFAACAKNIRIMKEVSAYYKARPVSVQPDPEMMKMAAYIINLPHRTERRKHIESQFSDKSEFEVTIVEACQHPAGTVGLWQSIRKIIEMATAAGEDVIAVCEDDHEFTEHYARESFFQNIIEAYYQGVDYINAGVSFFDYSVPVSDNRYWMHHGLGGQFLVIYSRFFKKILEAPYDTTVVADMLLPELTSAKMFLYPSVSTQKEFGYSDVTLLHQQNPGLTTKMFKHVEERMNRIDNIRNRYYH